MVIAFKVSNLSLFGIRIILQVRTCFASLPSLWKGILRMADFNHTPGFGTFEFSFMEEQILTNHNNFHYICTLKRPGGETGIHVRLRCVCRKVCRFESCSGHWKPSRGGFCILKTHYTYMFDSFKFERYYFGQTNDIQTRVGY